MRNRSGKGLYMRAGELIDPETGVFRRGKHSGEAIEEVAEKDVEYLEFLYEKGKIGEHDRHYIEQFLEHYQYGGFRDE